MKLPVLTTFFSGLALASLHGPGMAPVHLHERDIPKEVEAQRPSILSKLAQVVPASVVSAIQANPTAFSNSNPPEFWNQLTDKEKNLLAELYPAKALEGTITVACTSTTTTTITLTTTESGSKVASKTAPLITSAPSAIAPPYVTSSTSSRPFFSFSPLANSTSQVSGTVNATGNVSVTRPSASAFTGKANALGVNLISIPMAAAVGFGFALLG